jgi:hypothetical protein
MGRVTTSHLIHIKLLLACAILSFVVPTMQGQNSTQASNELAPRQNVAAIEVNQYSQQYYANEAAWWREFVKRNASNEQGWLNYYKALRYTNYTPQSRSINSTKQKQLDDVLAQMGLSVPGTFAYYYASYLNGNKSESAYLELLKAYQLRADEQELWDDLLSYAIIYNKPSEATKFASLLSNHRVYNAHEVSYNRNVLNSIEQNGILITHGNVDTYPILIMQYLNDYRKDVKVVCLEWLGNEAYVNQVSKWIGYDINPNASLTDILKSNSNIYVALTVPPNMIESHASELYCTGLTLKHSIVPVDNLSALKNNWERLFEKQWIDEREQLNRNYILPLVQLKEHYKQLGDAEHLQEIQGYFEKLAKGFGLNKVYNNHKD